MPSHGSSSANEPADGRAPVGSPAGEATDSNLHAGRRPDAPPAFAYTRGCKRTALEIARDPARRQAAVDMLESRVYAEKTKGPRAERQALWQEVLAECGHPPAPFTAEAFRDGTAVLLAAGYRTAFMIAEQALLTYIEQGGTLTDALRRRRAMFRRACARGLGPPKRSDAWPLELSVTLPMGRDPLVAGGPIYPRRLFVCCCWWMAREIEAGNAAVVDVTILPTAAAWALPASKTDISALGTARMHGCACGRKATVAAKLPPELCPSCQLAAQHAMVVAWLGERDTAPLWPDDQGSFCTKKAMIDTIVAAAKLLNLRIKTPAGAEAWGGHAFRRGGAQYLAQQGIDVWRIQALARHSSNAIMGYLDEANLSSLKGLSTDVALGKSIDAVRTELAVLAAEARADKLARMVQPPAGACSPAHIAVVTAADEIVPEDRPLADGHEKFVVNTLPDGKLHIIHPQCAGMTYCRWQWKASKHALPAHSPVGFAPCMRCQSRQLRCSDRTADPEPSSSSGESEPVAQDWG